MDTPNEIVYTVTADSTGGRAGTSSVPALGISHVMRMPKELGGPGDGPNPEALFAMGYGACFQGAMGLAAKELGIDTKDSVVRTTIGLGPEGDSFALTADIQVFIPGVELDRAQALVDRAHQLCPYRGRRSLSAPDRRKNPDLVHRDEAGVSLCAQAPCQYASSTRARSRRSSTWLISRAECIDNRPTPTSTVRIPRRVAVIGPIVVPHGIALLPTKFCDATPAAAHARFHRAMPSASVA